MVLYELTTPDACTYLETKREALDMANKRWSVNCACTIDRIETARVNANLFVRVLNGEGFVTKRKAVWENAEGKRVREMCEKIGWSKEVK